jgi:hypothetical protein
VVIVTHRFHTGHVIEERMRLVDGGARLVYAHAVTGPDSVTDAWEITFAV